MIDNIELNDDMTFMCNNFISSVFFFLFFFFFFFFFFFLNNVCLVKFINKIIIFRTFKIIILISKISLVLI